MSIPLHAGNPSAMTGSGNWTYFLSGRAPVLIDAGVGEASHVDLIARTRPEGPGRVVVTHAHVDHILGAIALAEKWPDTEFAKMPWPERDALYPVPWTPLRDGESIPAGDGRLEVIHTPGHAPDHIVLWDAHTRTLFSGDLVVRGTTVVIPASLGGSLSAYLQSLDRVLALRPVRLLPAHGDPIDDPERLIREYIAHRLQRETQVQAALQRGRRTAEELVKDIYVGLTPALVPMARESVLAHLRKLEDEGRVRRAGDDWTIIEGD